MPSARPYSYPMSTSVNAPADRRFRTCREQVVWADDIEAMKDGVCGDCQDDGCPVCHRPYADHCQECGFCPGRGHEDLCGS